MYNLLIKFFGSLIDFVLPGKLKELQIRISRLNINSPKEIQDFIDLYDETFPFDGSNYTSGELLEVLEDIQNSKKHVTADNIILVAKYQDKIVGFIACFFYPQKKYGIIGYFGKTKSFNDVGKYCGTKLLKELKKILIEKHDCELLVFELKIDEHIKGKKSLFKSYTKNLGLVVYELLNFQYFRPKLNLDDTTEEELELLIIPIKNIVSTTFSKEKILDILNFIHFYCYGDYYEKDDNLHSAFQRYLQGRVEYYESNLQDEIGVK